MTRLLRRTYPALAILAAGYIGVRRCLMARLAASPRPSAGARLDFREVRFRSTDGLTLTAWWSSRESSPRAAVLVHARGGSKRSPYVLETALIYARAGFNVLALDLRSRGGSEGRFLTAGYQEVHDVRGALSWLERQGFDAGEVMLHGWSTGAVTVVRAAPGTGVAAVVEESGYADLPILLGNRLPGKSGPSDLLCRVAFLTARALKVDFDPWALRPREEAERLYEEGVPLLIIHSRDDRVVPFEHARLLSVAHPGAALWELEGREHAAAHKHPQYADTLMAFMDKAKSVRREGGLDRG